MARKSDGLAVLDLAQLEAAIQQAEADLSATNKALTPLEQTRNRQFERLKRLIELHDKEWIARMGATPDWKWLLDYNPYWPESRARSQTRSQALSAFGLVSMGASHETRQYQVQIALAENDDAHTQKCLASLQQLLPALKPAEHGGIDIHVTTHDMGESGIYTLRIAPDQTQFEFMFQPYGALGPTTIRTEYTLAQMLTYIQQHYAAIRD